MHGGIRRLFRQHAVRAHDAGQLAFGQHILRQHDMNKMIAARRLRVENLAVAGDVEAPGIAAAGGILFDLRPVRFEANHSAADGSEALAAIAGLHVVRARIAVRGINPAIEAPAHVVDDGVRVAVAEVGVELGALVGFVVAVRVFEEPYIGRGADDDAVFVKHAAGGQLDLVGKDGFFVHDTVAVRVGEDGDAIERFAVVVAGLVGTAVLPRVHIRLAEAIRILRRLDDPQATFFIPVDVHGLVDQRLGGDEAQIELGMHFERLRQLLRAGAAALDITQRIAQLGRFAQLFDVFTFSGPGDAAEDQGADAVVAEVAMIMARDAGEGAIRRTSFLTRF